MVTSIHCLIQTSPQSIYYGPTNKGNNLDRLYGINIDPELFNPNTYVSHIKTYIEPTHKLSAPNNINYITSSTLHCILNKSCPKGTGSDGLPGWFLKLISPAICEPLSTIYNNCIKQAFFRLSGEIVLFTLLKK